MSAIKDILQRIRNDRAKQQGTWIGVDESHIILNALEKSERIETENAELRARLDKDGLPVGIRDIVFYIDDNSLCEGEVREIIIDESGFSITLRKSDFIDDNNFKCADLEYVYIKDYKETWFTDRAEAEARLKEWQDGKK